MQDEQDELRVAIGEELERLALELGGATDTGGPVENATQIKDRGDLGVLLTDARGFVLGRVWLEFVGNAALSDAQRHQGSVGLTASVRSETVFPPMSVEDWLRTAFRKGEVDRVQST